jgi:hypothetical protein
MTTLRAQAKSLTLGLLAGIFLGANGAVSTLRPAEAAKEDTRRRAERIIQKQQKQRVVVGLRDPLTPTIIKELRSTFKSRILNLTPGNTYALVLLRPGETLAEVQARSLRIQFVEPEVAMGVAQDARMAAVVIPAPRAPKAPKKK